MRRATKVLSALILASLLLPGCRPPPRRRPLRHPAAVFGDTSTLVFGGDTVLARRLNLAVGHDDESPALPLAGLRPILAAADLSLVNLECVLTNRGAMAEKNERNPYYLRGRPDLVRVLVQGGVRAVTLANNHAGDYGPEALAQTLALLDAAGIQHVGAGETPERAAAPAFRTTPDGTVVALVGLDTTQATFEARHGAAGTNFVSASDPDRAAAEVRAQVAIARRHAHLVFVTVHWGPNNADAPTEATRRLGRALIDAGADAVLGHSAHRVQGIEIHRNKPILYDAGNLLWDYDDDGPSHQGLLFRLHFDRGGVRWVEALPIRLRKNRTGPDPDGETALARFERLCGELGTEVLRFAPEEGGTVEPVGHVVIWEDPEMVDPPDPAGAPAPPLPTVPGRAALYPRSDVVVEVIPADAARFDPPIAFENGIQLLAWRTETPRVRRQRPLVVSTWWRSPAPLFERWSISLQAEGTAQGQKPFAGGDAGLHDAGDWVHPTDIWFPDDVVHDRFDVRPFPDVPPGTYSLWVSMQREGGARLPVRDRERHDGSHRIPLGTFEQTADP